MNVRLQLLSWNVHGPPLAPQRAARLGRVGVEILRRQPDLVLLQEVWFRRDAKRLAAQLRHAYQLVDVPRGGLLGRVGGLITFVRRSSGWSVTAAHYERFSVGAAAWKLWQGDGIGQKGIQRIDLAVAGRRLVILNTHLQSDYRWDDYARIRGLQLRDLQRLAAAVTPGLPVIAGGDLNTRPHEPLYTHLCGFWEDLTREAREVDGSGTCLNPDGSDAGWRDYILARRDPPWHIRALQLERIINTQPDHPFSDHQGLDITLRIAATGAH